MDTLGVRSLIGVSIVCSVALTGVGMAALMHCALEVHSDF